MPDRQPRAVSIVVLAALCTIAGDTRAQAPDTLRTYHVGEQLIAAPAPRTIGEPGRTELPWNVIVERDAATLESVAPLLPSTRVATNSRGEAAITIRAATLRQVAVFQDGVRLNVPWDERVDVSQVPTAVVGAINVTRGTASVLDGPNTPGGIVHLVSRDLATAGSRQRLWVEGGEAGDLRLGWLGLARRGAWSALGSVERRRRDGFLIPRDLDAPRNQAPNVRLRTNSQSTHTAVYARLVRELRRGGTLALAFSGSDADKGVTPETHTADARFWRIRDYRRGLVSAVLDWTPDEEKLWHVAATAALDGFRQDIQAYPDSTYTASADVLAANLEENRDTTWELRLRAHRNGARRRPIRLGLTASWRATTHREREGVAPGSTFAQHLGGFGSELDARRGAWSYRIGAGLDVATTPETGDKPDRDGIAHPVWVARVSRDLAPGSQVHASYGRRSRFPSLRELFSGALGRFVANPDLSAETLDTLELSAGVRRPTARLSGSIFAQQIGDGIVRVALENRQFQRRNEERIRTIGVEIDAAVRLSEHWQLALNHSLLGARARAADGEFDARIERRPEFLSHAQLAGTWSAWKAQVEATATGPFYSLDGDTDLLVKLPSSVRWDGRVAWRHRPTSHRPWSGEIFVRVNNLADAISFSQLGLPSPGRQASFGMRVEL